MMRGKAGNMHRNWGATLPFKAPGAKNETDTGWEAFGDTHKVKTGVRLGKMSFRLVVVPKRASD